ncbi:unnamed protein product [Caretta caretta]
MPGRFLHLWVCMEGLVVNLINIYAKTSGPERLRFYQQASACLGSLDPQECLVLGGDFNTTHKEYGLLGAKQCPAAADVLQEIVDHHSLVDVWRDHHPDDVSRFTFVRVETIGLATPVWATSTCHASTFHGPTPPASWWDVGKVCARLSCRYYTQGASRQRDAVIEQLEREVLELERRLAASPKDPSLCGVYQEKREELQALEDHQAWGAFV